MMKNKFVLILAAIIAIAVAIFLWQTYFGDRLPRPEEKNPIVESSDNQEVGAKVTYRDGVFSPNKITINEELDCVLSVSNIGDKTLKLGLNPHSEKGDPGVIHPDTPPGETILVDPRYRIERIAFHDHNNPANELEVELEGLCKDF